MKSAKPLRSLKSKALQLLAQREQSRLELRRKLIAHALAEEAAHAAERALLAPAPPWSAAAACPAAAPAMPNGHAPAEVGGKHGACHAGAGNPSADTATAAADRVDEVLAWLDAHRFQSDARFAESRVNARAGRYGDLRIRHELKQHGVALDAAAAQALGQTEGARAWAVWERRFGAPPATASEAAKQSRFLSARGFSPDAVRQVLRRARRAGTGADAPPGGE